MRDILCLHVVTQKSLQIYQELKFNPENTIGVNDMEKFLIIKIFTILFNKAHTDTLLWRLFHA